MIIYYENYNILCSARFSMSMQVSVVFSINYGVLCRNGTPLCSTVNLCMLEKTSMGYFNLYTAHFLVRSLIASSSTVGSVSIYRTLSALRF